MEIKKIMDENPMDEIFDVEKEGWMDDMARTCNQDCKYWQGSGMYNNHGCIYVVNGSGNIYW